MHTVFISDLLQAIFAVMLILAGSLGVLQVSNRIRFGKVGASIVGFASGFFGGLVGEQGGIRFVALLNFNLEKEAFIATATATGLIVDVARMPVYFFYAVQSDRQVCSNSCFLFCRCDCWNIGRQLGVKTDTRRIIQENSATAYPCSGSYPLNSLLMIIQITAPAKP